MPMIASLLCGLVFGAGLLISGMVQPAKVLAFLDIFGAWDPSLAIVMIAALAVSTGFHAGKAPYPASARRAKRLADQDTYRPAAYHWGSPIRNRLGSCRLVPGAGFGKPCDAITAHNRLRCGHGWRRASPKYLAAISANGAA